MLQEVIDKIPSDLNKLDGYLVNKTFTLTQKEFQEQFICIKEKEEMVYLE